MKKVMCPKCEEVFEIDETSDLLPTGCVHCKKCHEPFMPDDGVKKLENEFKGAVSAAYKDMYMKQNYEQAAGEYEYALTLKNDDLGAIVGSTLAKIYASKLNDRAFLNIIDALESRDIVLNAENTFIYLSFVRDAIYSFEQFLKMSRQNLTKDGIFYNKDFFSYYLDGIKEINKVMNYFKNSLSLVDNDEYESFQKENTLFNQDFETMTNGIRNRLNSDYKVNELGYVKVSNGETEVIRKENYEGVIIPLEVDLSLLPLNKKAIKVRRLMIGYFSLLTVMMIVFLVIYFVTKLSVYLWFLAIPIVLAAIGYFLFTYLIKKSY
jgi:tetratricopeptide (TPR) repeat protein